MRTIAASLLLPALLLLGSPAQADVAGEPGVALVVHGLLRDGADRDLSGRHDVVVEIFDAPAGGELLLTQYPDPDGVEVSRGLFRLVLNREPASSDSPVAKLFAGAGVLWMQIRVDGVVLQPRLPVSAPSPAASSERAAGSWGAAPRLELLARADDVRLYGPPIDAVAGIDALVLALPEAERPPPFALPGEVGGEETYPELPDVRQTRLDWFRGARTSPFGRMPEGAMSQAWEFRDAMAAAVTAAPSGPSAAAQSVVGDSWVDIGPAPVYESTGKHSSGRIRAVVIDPGDPSSRTFYIGAAQGGIWKTTDGGAHWVPLTDHEASLATGSLALDPQDTSIVYAGTGESGGGDAYYGAGVLKSLDGGSSWSQMGAKEFDYAHGGARIQALAIDPTPVASPDEQRTLYAAADSGLWRSVDGGRSWTKVQTGAFTDVVIDPNDSQTVYAARHGWGIYKSIQRGSLGTWIQLSDGNGELPTTGLGRLRLVAVDGPVPGTTTLFTSMRDSYYGQSLKGIWKSSNGGANWTRVTGHPFRFSQGQWVSPQRFETENNDTIPLADDVSLNQVAEGWITTAGDIDFWRVTVSGNALDGEILADRAGSGLDVKLSLYDGTGSLVYAMGDPMVYDGGLPNGSADERLRMFNWKTLTPGTYYIKVESSGAASSGRYQLSVIGIDLACQCEYDQVLAVNPDDPAILYMGQVKLHRSVDGGANWSDIHNHGGSNWIHVDIQAATFDPHNSDVMLWGSDGGAFLTRDGGETWTNLNTDLSITQPYAGIAQHSTDPDLILLGAQDIGVVKRSGGTWSLVVGGDGAFNAIASSSVWWGSAQRLYIFGTTDGGSQLIDKTSGLGRAGAAFIAPFVLDPNNSQVLIAGGGEDPGTGMQRRVYRTTNGGDSWSVNSQHLGSVILALAFAPSNSSTYYAGTAGGAVWRTTNAGASNWTNLTKAPLPANRYVLDIAVHPTDPNTVYAVFGGFGTGHVFKSTNGGTTWTDVSGSSPAAGSLPDVPVNAIVIDPVHPNTLFVGTDASIWRSLDGGASWYPFDHNLPRAAVFDLVLGPNTGPGGRLRAATHGRGIWELRTGNDSCENAITIGNGFVWGNTLGATSDGSAGCGNSASSPDVWYRYTATCDGYLEADTCSAGYDTVVSVHGASCPGTSGNEAACNDDCSGTPCSGRSSCTRSPVQQGQEYLIRVSGYGGDAGSFGLDVRCEVPGDLCDEAIALTVPAQRSGSTAGAGADYAPVCNGEANTASGVWYTVVGTGNTLTATTCSAATVFDTKLSVYCAGCGNKSCVTANDDDYTCAHGSIRSTVSWCSAPGRVYHILVHGYQSQEGDFGLQVTDSGTSCGIALACQPSNDLCSAAAPVDIFGLIGDNTDAGTDGASRCAPSNGDVWWEFLPVCHGFVTFDTCGSGTLDDTVLSVHDGCGRREIACGDDTDECGHRAKASTAAVADRALVVRVADYGTSVQEGTFSLDPEFSLTYPVAPRDGLYLSDAYSQHLQRVDPLDGHTIDVGPMVNSPMTGMTYHPDLGLMYGVRSVIDGTWMNTVDLETGAATPFAEIPYHAVDCLAFNPQGDLLYAVENAGNTLLEINPFNAAVRVVGPVGFSQVEGLAFDPAIGVLYAADTATDQLLVLNLDNGAGTAVGPFGLEFDRISGLTWDRTTGTLFGVQSDPASIHSSLVRIDTETGAATRIGGDWQRNGLAIASVPGLLPATVGQYYEAIVPAAGGCPFYGFANATGLPPGLSLDPRGKISGVPQANGTYEITFDVDDSNLSTPGSVGTLQLRVRPPNDDCEAWIEVGPPGVEFSTREARTDGPVEPLCDLASYDGVDSDVWFCYVASCTGELTVNLCESDYDNRVAVYAGCGCVSGPGTALACDDDSCGGSLGAWLTLPVTAGQAYGIRVGGFHQHQGNGTLLVDCLGAPAGACCLPGACAWTSEEECLARRGEYRGPDSACEPDSDGDSVADLCDGCPEDPGKSAPGSCGCGVPDLNTDGDPWPDCVDDDDDGDGIVDPEDGSPLDRYRCGDFDHDGCEDCTSGGFDPAGDGPDADADGACDLGDCDDGNPATFPGAPEVNDGLDNQCPGEYGYGFADELADGAGFHDPGDRTAYSWHAQERAFDYQVARSRARDFSAECDSFYTTIPVWHDAELPGPAEAFYYLVRAYSPHPGSWGWNSEGVERNVACP